MNKPGHLAHRIVVLCACLQSGESMVTTGGQGVNRHSDANPGHALIGAGTCGPEL